MPFPESLSARPPWACTPCRSPGRGPGLQASANHVGTLAVVSRAIEPNAWGPMSSKDNPSLHPRRCPEVHDFGIGQLSARACSANRPDFAVARRQLSQALAFRPCIGPASVLCRSCIWPVLACVGPDIEPGCSLHRRSTGRCSPQRRGRSTDAVFPAFSLDGAAGRAQPAASATLTLPLRHFIPSIRYKGVKS